MLEWHENFNGLQAQNGVFARILNARVWHTVSAVLATSVVIASWFQRKDWPTGSGKHKISKNACYSDSVSPEKPMKRWLHDRMGAVPSVSFRRQNEDVVARHAMFAPVCLMLTTITLQVKSAAYSVAAATVVFCRQSSTMPISFRQLWPIWAGR